MRFLSTAFRASPILCNALHNLNVVKEAGAWINLKLLFWPRRSQSRTKKVGDMPFSFKEWGLTREQISGSPPPFMWPYILSWLFPACKWGPSTWAQVRPVPASTPQPHTMGSGCRSTGISVFSLLKWAPPGLDKIFSKPVGGEVLVSTGPQQHNKACR